VHPPSSGTGTPAPNPTASSAQPAAGKIRFSGCSSLFDDSAIPVPSSLTGKIEFSCGRLDVPLDYANASGRTISLYLVLVLDKDTSDRIGSLLVNPGGPGGSGLELALGLTGSLDPTILEHFDLIGFDPRGVGLSSPIHCISDAEKDRLNAASPDVRTAAGFAQAKQLAKEVADACSTTYGPALAQYNTVNTARDMDVIRRALGDDSMNYLGFSYGTELGGVYAHLFPDTIRVAVLDGAVNPLTNGIQSFADQLDGFEKAFDQFANTYCEKTSPCTSLGDPRRAVYDIVAQAQQHPLGTSDPSETRQVTSSLVLTGVLEALYSQSEWSDLSAALIAAKKGDGGKLLALADQYNQRRDGHYTNIMDANTTISCNDEKAGPTDAQIRATTAQWVKKFPMFGLWAAGSLFSCQQWQPDRTPVPLPKAPTAHQVLVIGNLHDPATPYQGAVDLARVMGNAELLSWDGEGHTSYLQGSNCIDNYVNTYLVDGKLPPEHTTCPR
jgi:pimeloyl-ACP methyl ester carboxylesterase